MRKTLISLLLVAPALALAQSQSGSTAGANASTAPIVITTNEAASSDTLKTTGSVFLPGNAVSSGGFNCTATASAGVGLVGASIGGSAPSEMQDCVRLNLLNFAVMAKDNALYEAIWCTIPAGRAAVVEAGLTCPADRRAGRVTTQERATTTVSTAPIHNPQ